MKTFLRKVLMFAMVFSMISGMVGTTAEAQETYDSVVIGGSEKLLLEVGKTYDVPVSFKKADDLGESSMAADSLTGSTLIVSADGTVTVQFHMTDITIMTAWGFAESLSLNDVHEKDSNATSMSITSTYSKKLTYLWNSKTYTIPSTFSGTIPYLDQNGVYTKMALKTGVSDMNQEGYFVFDFASLNADYSAVNAAMAKVPADVSMYTKETAEALNEAVNNVEFYYHKDRQVEVDAMAAAVEVAVENLVDPHTYFNADVYGIVPASPSTFTVSIPETIQLGDLSILEDTVVTYELGVDMIPGNDGSALEVVISGGSDEKLVFGNNEIPLLNSLTSYTFTNSEVIEEAITVEASMVNLAYHGDYQGTVTFYIDSAYVLD